MPKRKLASSKSKESAKSDTVKEAASATTSTASCTDKPSGKRLATKFYEKSCVDLSKALLGKRIVRKLDNGDSVWGKIVETEAYLGGDDKAAHSYEGKRTERNAAMFMDPGTIYVYHIYGAYTCINFSSQGM